MLATITQETLWCGVVVASLTGGHLLARRFVPSRLLHTAGEKRRRAWLRDHVNTERVYCWLHDIEYMEVKHEGR